MRCEAKGSAAMGGNLRPLLASYPSMDIELNAPRTRVLFADDDEDLRVLVGEALRGRGCDVVEAADGCQAIVAALLQDFDVAVLDLEMPCLDGTIVLRALKRMGEIARVFLFTGLPQDLRIPVGRDAPDAVFEKSRGLPDLLHAVCPDGCAPGPKPGARA